MNEKMYKIPHELFMKLLRYHLLDDDNCAADVKKVWNKMNAMAELELYTKSKTAPSEEEAGKARQEVSGQARNTKADFSMVILLLNAI